MSRKKESREETSKRRAVMKTNKGFWIFTVGFLLCLGPFAALYTLQSSINIEENVGTMTLGIAYFISIFVSVFFTPIAIRKFGSKWVLIFGEVTYLLYSAANFYPKMYMMLIVGVLVGVGEAFIWTALPLYCWHFGYLRGKIKTKPHEFYVQKYTALFWGVFQLSQIFGNAISYAVLYGAKNKTEEEHLPINATIKNTTTLTTYDAYQYCGTNDCQNANVTEENMDQFVPSAHTLYILISIFCAIILCGIGLHIRYLPNAILNTSPENKPKVTCVDDDDEKEKCVQNASSEIRVKTQTYKATLWATAKHAVDPKQLLITPLITCMGLVLSFEYSEGIRSYAACILGVEQVGAVMIVYAVFCGVSSAISDKLIGKCGRNIIMLTTLLLHVLIFIVCLFWQISEESKYLVYLIYALFGCSESLGRNCCMDIYTWYFPCNQEISYNVWNIWSMLGFSFGFLWSPLLCTETKIYCQLGFLLVSFICYGFAEYIYKMEKSKPATEAKTNSAPS